MTKEWRTVAEFPSYSVSSDGDVRRDAAGRGAVSGRVLRWHTCTSSGYPTVRFVLGGVARSRTVHKVVSRAFLGPLPAGMVVRHLDGNKMNNSAMNLAYGTTAENNADKVRHGTSSAGEKNPRAKLTGEQARSIRADYGFGMSAASLASAYGISESTVYRIVSGVYWKGNRAMDKATT